MRRSRRVRFSRAVSIAATFARLSSFVSSVRRRVRRISRSFMAATIASSAILMRKRSEGAEEGRFHMKRKLVDELSGNVQLQLEVLAEMRDMPVDMLTLKCEQERPQ